MNCFVDYIGLRGCGTKPPPSGFYANSLEGISIKALDSASNEEQKNYKQLWSDVQARAALRFGSEVRAAMIGKVKVPTVKGTEHYGRPRQTQEAPNVPGHWVGVGFEMPNSPYQVVYIDTVRVYSLQNNIAFQIRIWDVNTLDEIGLIETVLTRGWNTIPVKKEFVPYTPTQRVFIGYDSDLYKLADNDASYWGGGDWPWLDCPSVDDICDCNGGWVTVQPQRVAKTDFNDLQNQSFYAGGRAYGLNLVYQSRCSLNAFICSIKDTLLMPWVNLVHYELLGEILASKRFNEYTVLKQDDIAGLQLRVMEDYKRNLEIAIRNIEFPCDCCFENDSLVSYQFAL